jgi:hypothetical protein
LARAHNLLRIYSTVEYLENDECYSGQFSCPYILQNVITRKYYELLDIWEITLVMSSGLVIKYSWSIYKVHEVCGMADHILGFYSNRYHTIPCGMRFLYCVVWYFHSMWHEIPIPCSIIFSFHMIWDYHTMLFWDSHTMLV